LDRILASKAFRQVDRLQRFLRFIVNESLSGSGDNLKEFVIGVEVFGRETSFDPRMDPIVRVQARRLRIRLTRYYREEGQHDEILIDLPKGGYAPLFQMVESPEPRHSVASVLSSRNTIVVAPFGDENHEHDLASFCRGLTQEVVHTLTNVKALRVLQWTPADDRPELTQPVHAAMRIGGSVRRTRNAIRVTVHLIDSVSRRYLWSTSIDRQLEDGIALQEEVARLISEKVQAEFGGVGHGREGDRPTENLVAYNFYLQGRHRLGQRTEDGLCKAAEFFDRAIGEDPQYAQAYSGLADAHGLLGHYGVLSPVEVCTKAASAAAWAVLLDDDSVEAHASLAHTKSTQDWDFLGAELEFQRAISLDPRYATAHHWYCTSCLTPLGRLDEALEEIQIAQALDPTSSIISGDVAMTHYCRHDLETALEQSDRTIEQNPHFERAYWTLGLIQEQRGDLDESEAAFRRGIQLAPQSPRMHSGLARTLAVSGRRSEAFGILTGLHDLSRKRYVSLFELATIHFALGEPDEGYEWLTKAFQSRCFELIFAKVDPRVDSLRGDARFRQLFAQLGVA
jgi:serine/threonine-protein kinase